MSGDLILHHYALSPFAEKIRLAMGAKNLKWRSVTISMMPPRPFLERLTGGYRRVPVLQVGADIYCDTHLILRTLDRLRPDPPALFSNSAAQPLCWWWDKTTFMPAVLLCIGLHGDNMPAPFIEDRKKYAPEYSFVKEDNKNNVPLNVQRISTHLAWLIDMLTDGRQFLLEGSAPSAFDITAYHTLWYLKMQGRSEVAALIPQLAQPGPLLSWFERMNSLGHGTSQEMTSEQAFDVAKQAEPVKPNYIQSEQDTEWPVGQRLRVTPDDTGRVSVEGTLVAVDKHEIVLRLVDEKAGNINIHFPRAGFDVVPV